MNKPFLEFIILFVLTIALIEINVYFLDINNLIFNNLAENLTSHQIKKYFEFQENFRWIRYVVIFIVLLIKVALIAAILDAGCFFFNKEIKYKTLFNIVVKVEFVFLLVIVFKTIWFYVFQQDYTLQDLQNFYPLSVLNIIGYEGLQPWFIYPLQTLNLFEFAYWFILAYLLGKELQIPTDKGFSIVASSYGVGLVIWVVAVMFFTLNMS